MGPRVASIDLSRTRIQFDALGDTLTFGATARTEAGSVLPADSLDYSIGDHTVATLQLNANLISVGAGQTTLTVRDPETDVIGQAVIVVDQIATTLSVRVDSGESFVRLPAGAYLPLSCEAFDKNGFPMGQDTVLVSSLKGTVTAGPCAGARIQRSGYDTLVFSLNEARVRVPVIISTRPDSVGVVAAAQALTLDQNIRYVGENFTNPSTVALRPLVAEILAAYGHPSTNLGRARAIRDWVARTAMYGDPAVHPNNGLSNLSALPLGKTWTDVNAVLSDSQQVRDVAYWADIAIDGYAVLNRLLGTLDPATGVRADDGLMAHVSGAQYRMRSIESYRFFLCTYQTVLAVKLWAAAGLQGLLLQTIGHDPAAVFIPELGRWVFEDPSFNNDYVDGDGDPLSPLDLLTMSTNGTAGRALPMRFPGPSYDTPVYVQNATYMNAINPLGLQIVGSRMYIYYWANATPWGRIVMVDNAELPHHYPFNIEAGYSRVTPLQAFPTLGVVVADVHADDSVFVIRLSSTYPNHQRFERRLNGGAWQGAADVDVLPVGQCVVEYRSVDVTGTTGAAALLNVWAPRLAGFLGAGDIGGTRRRAQDCH